jgi:hypothetical protein
MNLKNRINLITYLGNYNETAPFHIPLTKLFPHLRLKTYSEG